MKKRKRKVCFIITSVIHYSRNFLILDALKKRKDVELHIVIGGVAISPKYTSSHFNVREILEKEGHRNIHEVYINMEGDSHVVKAKTIGLAVLEFSSIFNHLKPDLVVVRGDRFEILAAAISAVNMNITLAHIEGGDITGTIDESIRHATTKLAHYHFATNESSRKRIIKMGENVERTFNFGSPDIEVAKKINDDTRGYNKVDVMRIGSGSKFNHKLKYLMVMYHPVTSEYDVLDRNVVNLLSAIHQLGMQTLWFWPNFDAGAEKISHELRHFREVTKRHKIRFMRYIPPKDFLYLLSRTECLIGNSSAGIKECSYLGVPVVNIGTRQNGRLKAKNVLCTGNGKNEIVSSVKKQLKRGGYENSNIYFSNETSSEIAKVIATCKLIIQKKFEDHTT